MKTFYNGRKIPIISPLLINDKLEADFKKKAHHFNAFFASKCIPLINKCVLPESVDYISTARLSSINFIIVDILKIIKYLNFNKAHGHDDIWLLSLYQLYSKIVLIMAFFLIFGKNPILFLFIKKVTNRSMTIIDLFLFYQFVLKFSKNYYSIQYLSFFMIIIFSVLISQDSNHQISVNINFFQYSMIFMHHLTVIHLLKLEVYFWTYLKHLIECDMKA